MQNMIPSPKILSCIRTVRFQDCDPFNHLNNGRYLDYFMNAREDHLKEFYDYDIYKLARESGLGWVVATSQMAYLRPVYLMEEVKIESQMIGYGPKDISVEMRMFDKEGVVLKSLLWCRFVHYNLLTNSTAVHNESMVGMFENMILPVEEGSFDERVAILKSKV